MKNYIKKLMTGLFALTFMIGFAVNVNAQDGNTDNASITATAAVLTAIEVSANGNLIFGNVSPNVNKSISNISEVTGSSATGGEQAGGFTITKGSNSFVTLEFDLPEELGPGSAFLPITFSETDARITTADDRSTFGADSESFDPNTQFNLENLTGDLKDTYFESAEFFVFIGGTVEPGADQFATTEYEGTITLTASYN